MERRERLALRDKVGSGKHLRYIRGIERRNIHENVRARPKGLRENAETSISCRRDLDPPERRKRYTCSREEKELDAQMCPCGKGIESGTHILGECEIFTWRKGMC